MALTPGVRLGPYEIVGLLGAGGMGEVYRARDHRLERDVAVKVLPGAFAADADRLRRFELEARATSLLSHPGILAIYDVGTADGHPYIVSELLDGETLRERLTRGPIAHRKSAELAAAVADALAAAHARGLIHSDLKPENVFLTRDQRVKIIDFGIAKLIAPDPAEPGGASTIPFATDGGVVIGTLGYMAPEQLRGERADQRSDLFALGALLHEMLSGTPAFRRDSRVATVNAVLESDPPELGEEVPPALRRIVSRCLEKDPHNRFQSSGDLAFALRFMSDTSAAITAAVPRGPVRPSLDVRWVATALVLTALMASTATWLLRQPPAPAPHVKRFTIDPAIPVGSFDVARDGSALAYAGGAGSALPLYVRQLGELAPKPVPGTEGARVVFFSPDGAWIAFVTGNTLRKVRTSGGPAVTLATVPDMLEGVWSDVGEIIIARREQGLMTVSAEGGPLLPLTTAHEELGEIDHHAPALLPGGRAILLTSHVGPQRFRIAVRSLDTGEQRTLIDDGFYARYVPSGHLVYGRGGALWAAPFDASRLQLTGSPVLVVEDVRTVANDGYAAFAAAGDGTLVYQPDVPRSGRTLVWVDRQGQREPLPLPPRAYDFPALSPDGARLAVQISEGETSDIWTYEFASGALHRFSSGGAESRPIWSADGRQLAWASRQAAEHRIVTQPLDASSPPRPVVSSRAAVVWPAVWTIDGRLIYVEDPPTSLSDIKQAHIAVESMGVVPADSARDQALVAGPAATLYPTLSPDGDWLAYVHWMQGQSRPQIMVRRLAGGMPRQITPDGGGMPRWSRDGKTIVFLHRATGQIMSVPVETTPAFKAGRPLELFDDQYVLSLSGPANYDEAPDGRFVFVAPSEREPSTLPIYIVEHWFEELGRRVPAPR
jgi:eukaryotic-like serine/threonine-protein kinase